MFTIITIAITGDPQLLGSLLLGSSVAKLGLLLVGFIGAAQKQISFYHCGVISYLASLLSIAEKGERYYAALTTPPTRDRLTALTRSMRICAALLHVIFSLPLVLVGMFMVLSGNPVACFGPTTVDFDISISSVSRWQLFGFSLGFLVLTECLPVMEALLRRVAPSIIHFQVYRKSDPLLESLWTASIILLQSQMLVSWLEMVDNSVDSVWDVGQLAPFILVVVALFSQVGDYALATSTEDNSAPRYKVLYRHLSMDHSMILAKL
jgi:hypothetical protein